MDKRRGGSVTIVNGKGCGEGMTCQQCGTELISKHFNAKFCAECKAERMRESVRKFRKKPGKTCQTCGEPLTSQHCNARYCADCKAARIRIATAKAAKKHRDAKKTHVPGSGSARLRRRREVWG